MPDTRYRFMERDINEKLVGVLWCEEPSWERVRILMSQGANVNAVDKNGRSILMHAVSDNRVPLEIIHYLIAAGADINAIDEEFGMSVLAHAASCGRLDVVQLLFQHGVHFETDAGALHYAAHSDNPEVLAFLLSQGVNPNLMASEIYTTLDSVDKMRKDIQNNPECIGKHNAHWPRQFAEVAKILRDAGARHADKLCATRLGTWLHVTGRCPTGLFTNTGCLAVELLPNVTEDVCARFQQWRESFLKLWERQADRRVQSRVNRPEKRANCKEGLKLAREIKIFIGPSIKVTYAGFNPDMKIYSDFYSDWHVIE